MIGSAIDHAIGSMFPGWALRRRYARHLLGQMDALAAHPAGQRGRTVSDWPTERLSADQANLPEIGDVTARARLAVRSDWLGAATVDAYRRNIAGVGITPRPAAVRIGDGEETPLPQINRHLARLWRQWARNPKLVDKERRKSFYGVQRLMVDERVTAGTAFVVTGYEWRPDAVGLLLQMFELEQLATDYDTVGHRSARGNRKLPEGHQIRHGIEIDPYGAPVAYYVHLDSHPLDPTWVGHPREPARIPARRVLSYGAQARPRETLAVSLLGPVLEQMWNRRGYDRNELIAKKIESFIGLQITRDPRYGSQDIGYGGDGGGGAGGGTGEGGDQQYRRIAFTEGMVPEMAPGEKVEALHFDRPGANYDAYMQRQTDMIAAGSRRSGTSVSRRVLGSYAAARQEMLDDWKGDDIEQQDLVDNVCRPVWELFAMMAVMEGRVPGLDSREMLGDAQQAQAYLEADWQPSPRHWVDPAKEMAALKIAIDYGIKNHADILNNLGRDWRENARTIAEVQALYRELEIPMPWADPTGSPSEPKVHGTGEDRNTPGSGDAAGARNNADLASVVIAWALREQPELAKAAMDETGAAG